MASIGSPTYKLSKHITSILSPLAGKSDSYVKDSNHFVTEIKDIVLDESELMLSFDVVLFTKVPVDEAVEVIHNMMLQDDSFALTPDRISELLEVCLGLTYFSYQGEYYEQREGAAMGSPVSAIIATFIWNFLRN